MAHIRPFIPQHARYFEPFFGGGSVFFDAISAPSYANDLHPDLMLFYHCVKQQCPDFFRLLYKYTDEWERSTLDERVAMYYRCRQRYNADRFPTPDRAADFFMLREFAFGGMFRVNSNGKFNVPFGRAYARNKNLRQKVEHLQSYHVQIKLELLDLSSVDFSNFLNSFSFDQNDFMFVDPPYDSAFSKYIGLDFNRADQIRLAEHLDNFGGLFMLVCKRTPLIDDLYLRNGYSIREYDYKYRFNIKGRFSRASTHIMVANYDLDFGK